MTPVPCYFIGTPNGGEFKDERYMSWFEVQADSLHVISAITKGPFHAYRLRIWTLPIEDIEHLEIRSMMLGSVEQLIDRIAASFFGPNVLSARLDTTTAEPGSVVSMTFRNLSPEPMKVSFLLEGVTAR